MPVDTRWGKHRRCGMLSSCHRTFRAQGSDAEDTYHHIPYIHPHIAGLNETSDFGRIVWDTLTRVSGVRVFG